MADLDISSSFALGQLSEQIAELRAVIEQQQEQIVALREQAELVERTVQPRTRRAAKPHGAGRRSLLKWAGAAAAATAVSVLATERPALAANGDAITAGNTTTASATTTLQAIGGSGATPLFFVDNSSATNSSGLWGYGSSGFSGLYGQGNGSNGRGIYGVSDSGYGVLAASITGIDIYAFGTGRIQQILQSFVGAPTSGSFTAGEQVRDSLGDLYLCVAGGSPGIWKKVAAIPAGNLGGAINILPVPIRLLNTLSGATDANDTPGAPITANAVLQMPVAGVTFKGQTIPAAATGVFGQISVISPTVAGGLTFYPSGQPQPFVSSIHFNAGPTVGNFTLAGIGSGGQVSILNRASASNDVVFDAFAFVM